MKAELQVLSSGPFFFWLTGSHLAFVMIVIRFVLFVFFFFHFLAAAIGVIDIKLSNCWCWLAACYYWTNLCVVLVSTVGCRRGCCAVLNGVRCRSVISWLYFVSGVDWIFVCSVLFFFFYFGVTWLNFLNICDLNGRLVSDDGWQSSALARARSLLSHQRIFPLIWLGYYGDCLRRWRWLMAGRGRRSVRDRSPGIGRVPCGRNAGQFQTMATKRQSSVSLLRYRPCNSKQQQQQQQ